MTDSAATQATGGAVGLAGLLLDSGTVKTILGLLSGSETFPGSLQRRAVESVRRRGFHSPDAIPFHARNALLSAQRMRFEEEWGEFNRALRHDDLAAIRDELADCAIVLYQMAYILDFDLDGAVLRKLAADEQRGYLHNGEATNV